MSTCAEAPLPVSPARLLSWSERNQQWLVAAIGRLGKRLEAQAVGPCGPSAPISDCIAADAMPGFTPALLQCAEVFALSPFERELLLLVAGLELDQGLRTAVAALNGGGSSRASFGLALGVLTQAHWDALSPDAALRYWQLLEPESGPPLTRAALHIDERVLHFITGVASSDARLRGVAHYIETQSLPLDTGSALLARRIAQSLGYNGEVGSIIVIHGEPLDPSALRDVGLGAAAYAGLPALWISAQDLPADPADLAALARRIDREVALNGALPLLSVGTATEPAAICLAGLLRRAVLWLGAPSSALTSLPEARRIVRFDVPAPDAARTRAALLSRWCRAAGQVSGRPADHAEEDNAAVAALDRAAAQFHLGPAGLDDVIERLDFLAPCNRRAGIWNAAREVARGGLDALAQRVVTRAGFGDLVLPPAQLATLQDIARHLRHQERVYQEWGFGEKHPRGQGLTALFAGESGTGKTLAAEAIANELELDLYRVDLATLVSKYIGETEKNLKHLFQAAEASGAVLLFDEADALFGKRSEVKDSHDRYANIEVAYLLQRVEAYRGLAILTTNMKSALDRAFLRRIRFVITFPFPDIAARERIWRLQFPARAPLGTIDFAALARLNLPGGHIRSIALNAAFKAADTGGLIDHTGLMAAARAEFAKLERSFTGPGGDA
jgi:hypothetical protein